MDEMLNKMIEDLNLSEKELKLLEEEIYRLDNKRFKMMTSIELLRDKINQYRLNNGLYHPMSELSNHIGKSVRNICLVKRKDDGALDIEWIEHKAVFDVYKDGTLVCFDGYDYHIEYSNSLKKYVKYDHGIELIDYVGFMSIEFYSRKAYYLEEY
jgi:hypothetical protein